ncbi:MAG TPA: hypothetical protein VKR31_10190 [Rhizomicrobium sp.]|nr:hypothetical protein [Rhizomicrobium sp.]
MKAALIAAFLLAAANTVPDAASHNPDPPYDAVLDARLKCPEEAPNVDAYIAELASWLGLAKARHPDWSNEETANARHALVVKHHCRGSGN